MHNLYPTEFNKHLVIFLYLNKNLCKIYDYSYHENKQKDKHYSTSNKILPK